MKKLIFLILLFSIYLITTKFEKKASIIPEVLDKKEEKIMVNLNINNEDKLFELEDYIVGVVACEMPASFNFEALKAMAVASRTYALSKMENNIIYTNENDQCYINSDEMKNKWNEEYNKYYNIIVKSVNETKGKYLSYNEEPIKAFYFSMSNGYTENVKNVFKEELNYLVSVPSPWDINIKNYEKTNTYSQEELKNKLNINEEINNIEIISRNETNHVNKVKVNNNNYSGIEFRKLLGLRSTDFTIELNENIIITTKGYGHGVGMSQYGANGMANEGYKYDEILKYYYKDIEIKNV